MNPPIKSLLAAVLQSLLSSTRRALRAAKRREQVNESMPTREVEERLATIDEYGHRMTVIRTRTLETVLEHAGRIEIERSRRHTLPGHGHVSRLSDTEFVVFHDGLKLRLNATETQVQGFGRNAPSHRPYEVSPAPRLYKPARRASRYPLYS